MPVSGNMHASLGSFSELSGSAARHKEIYTVKSVIKLETREDFELINRLSLQRRNVIKAQTCSSLFYFEEDSSTAYRLGEAF